MAREDRITDIKSAANLRAGRVLHLEYEGTFSALGGGDPHTVNPSKDKVRNSMGSAACSCGTVKMR